MDKNTVVGLIVIAAMLFGFSWYSSNQSKKFAEEKRIQDSIAYAKALESGEPEIIRSAEEDSLSQQAQTQKQDSLLVQQFGKSLVAARSGQEHTYKVENDFFIITFSNKGGKVVGVELKDYKNYSKFSKGNVQLYAPNSARFNLEFFINHGLGTVRINTEDYYFTTDSPESITFNETETQQHVSMKLHVDSTSYMEYLYTIHKDNYMIDFDVRFVNMEQILSNQSDVVFSWSSIAPQHEKGFKNENNATTISYKYPGDKSVENIGISEGSKQEVVNSQVQWIAFKQQFFSSIFIAENNFQNVDLQFDTYAPDNVNIKKFNASLTSDFDRNTPEYNFHFYYGPNKYAILKKYDISTQRLIPLGGNIIGIVNRALVIPVFDWLEKTGMNYGLIILILTFIIKIIIFPLTYKSYLSTAKMRLIKPEMDALTAKYPKQEDAMKRQQAMMALYKQAGVNPMGGCLPLLIQFPILIAMFRFFPASIELRGQPFLWADDLSSYDSILQLPFNIPFYGDHVSLFTLLMAVSMHISARINYAVQPDTSGQPGMGMMKGMMLWVMPIMLLAIFNNYSSGLSYYYLLSNMITMGQTFGFRYIVNDEKLHARMKQNAAKKSAKPKKKSKWQQRYEEMIREQQRQAQNSRKR